MLRVSFDQHVSLTVMSNYSLGMSALSPPLIPIMY